MSLEALKKPDATDQESEGYSRVIDTLDKVLAETRTIAHLLHPPLLDDVGFRSAARVFLEGFAERSGIKVNLRMPDGPGRLIKSPEVELVLFRILQESLTNVHRHAHTNSVDVQVEIRPSEVALEIRDYGKGMQPELLRRFKSTGEGAGVGLSSMRERVSELGGLFNITSDSKGTVVHAFIPLPATVKESALATANGPERDPGIPG